MEANLYPFEFIVQGTPRSLQTKNRANLAEWIDDVRKAARMRRDEAAPNAFLDDLPIAATLTYFAPAPVSGDIDNIVKPILDAMSGVAYRDDELIEHVTVRKVVITFGWTFAVCTELMTKAIATEPPVVHVRIDADKSWRNVQ